MQFTASGWVDGAAAEVATMRGRGPVGGSCAVGDSFEKGSQGLFEKGFQGLIY